MENGSTQPLNIQVHKNHKRNYIIESANINGRQCKNFLKHSDLSESNSVLTFVMRWMIVWSFNVNKYNNKCRLTYSKSWLISQNSDENMMSLIPSHPNNHLMRWLIKLMLKIMRSYSNLFENSDKNLKYVKDKINIYVKKWNLYKLK